MDAREQRGLAIAALCKIAKQDDAWLVPSQSGPGTYTVRLAGSPYCSCPDHESHGGKCKHIYAAEFVHRREEHADGSVTVVESLQFTEIRKRTYKQKWPAYNLAQSMEKDRLQELLADLCRGLPEPERKPGPGRKGHSVADAVFAMVYKVYSTFSTRRFASDLREAKKRRHVSRAIPAMKVCHFFERPALTPILKQLVGISALPLRVVESDFAIDSTGFSTCKFERWYDEKYGVTRQKHVWVKAHCACGVKTNVVTAIQILDKDAADCPQFPPLLKDTVRNFQVAEVSADKAYLSQENFEAVADCGGEGFIAFKSNSSGRCGGLFERMFHYFQFRRDEFLQHYHKRSNAESTFSAIKRKFGDFVRAKGEVAMVNEVLCKVVAHNLCCLIQEQCELGITPVFWGEPEAKPEPPAIDVAQVACEEPDFAEFAFL